MAKINSVLGNISGKLGPLVYYPMRGSENMVVRTKGIVSRSARKHHHRYERTRQENMEFKGCVMAARNISRAMFYIKSLGDFNSFGQLVRICKYIQQADTELPKGRRSLLISRSYSLLDGFSFNKYNTFETMVRPPVSLSIDRQNGTLHAAIPSMRPGVHLFNHTQQPYYRIVCTLAKVSDWFLTENSRYYETHNNEHSVTQSQFTPWINWKDPLPATELIIHLPDWVDLPHRTLIAGIGIAFGREVPGGSIEFTKYAGAGKIWAAV